MTGYNMPPGVNERDIDRAFYGTCWWCGAILDGEASCPSCGSSVTDEGAESDESEGETA